MENGRRQPSRDGTSRMMREYQVRICERLGVRFPGPTRQSLNKVNLIAKALERLAREGLVHALDFLKADDVGAALSQPGQHIVQPLADRIDVPGGDAHARLRRADLNKAAST